MPTKFARRLALTAPLVLSLTGCLGFGGSSDVAPHLKQLPAAAQVMLVARGMTEDAPIFIRIFKEESELEVWKLKDGRFEHFKTYPICAWSGELGPKLVEGDKQAPEGFYTVTAGAMNPNSQFHLSFNLGYPNAFDRANSRTGSALMVHGDCKSAGCYAMTDALIEEIYILAREAFKGGQTRFHVHAFPFRMTEENMKRHQDSKWYPFWVSLKEGYDAFEQHRKPPVVRVCSKQYLVNVDFLGLTAEPDPQGPCPMYAKIDPETMNGIDGIPRAVLVRFQKPEDAATALIAEAPRAAPSVALASASSQPRASTASTSSSPVVRARAATPVMASLQALPEPATAAPPAEPAIEPRIASLTAQELAPDAPLAPPPRVAVAQPALPASPVMDTPSSVQIGGPASTIQTVEPSAMQVPAAQVLNRSGKGGKLVTGDHHAPAPGTPAVAIGGPVAIGLAPQAEAAPAIR